MKRRALAAVLSLVLLVAATALTVAAQELPACAGDGRGDCVLPDWLGIPEGDLASPFGRIDGDVWVTDAIGDTGPGGLDVLAVGIGRVEVTDPAAVRGSDDLLKLGGRKKAVKGGSHVLLRIVLDRPLSQIDEGHSSVHIATDVDGSRGTNAPSGVGSAGNHFAGTQDVYSLTYAATTGKSKLLKSDLAKGWYKSKGPYAAMWVAPNVLDVIVSPQKFGDAFRVVTYVSGADGGYDSVDLGPADIPVDGRAGLLASCIEGSISDQPFTVGRLIENGQTLRNVEAPASWRGGVTFRVPEAELSALQTVVGTNDDDGDGVLGLASTVNLFENGVVLRQRPEIGLRLEGDAAQLWLEIGLTRRGYSVLRDIELEPTGDALADAWLGRATDELADLMPPFRVARKPGLLTGEGIGACIGAFALPPQPVEPVAEDAAASA